MTNPIRAMIVDDSHMMRTLMTQSLEDQKDIVLLPSAVHGEAALRHLATYGCDVILLDIDMPLIDGLTAIPLLLGIDPDIQIIIVSSLISNNPLTLLALQAGAVDFILKPNSQDNQNDFHTKIIEKVRLFGNVAQRKHVKLPPAEKGKHPFSLQRKNHLKRPDIIAIGSSTGGPQALFHFLRPLKNRVTQPIVITQHMPSSFTTLLARHITAQTGIDAIEGINGMRLQDNKIYIAPGNAHMIFYKDGTDTVIKLDMSPPVNYCRPSVDVMLRSLNAIYKDRVLAILLTGLGSDGKNACVSLHAQGGGILAQDEESAVVWGMPGAVAQAGICSAVLPLPLLAQETIRIAHL